MNEEIMTEIKNLNDNDLLTLYDNVVGHLQYLKDSILQKVEEAPAEESQENGGEKKDE